MSSTENQQSDGADRDIVHCVDVAIDSAKHPETVDVVEGLLWGLELPEFERLDSDTFSEIKAEERPLDAGEIRWRFSFESPDGAEALAKSLADLLAGFEVDVHLWSRDVTGYRTAWVEYFKPHKVSPRFWVHPPWDVPDVASEMRIEIDPGMAFGTGTHETTRLCLRLVDELADEFESVFEVGTGSGILLIGAAKLGKSPLIGVDVDPVAIPEAIRNAQSNGVGASIEFDVGSAGYSTDTYDLVIANILPHILQNLREELGARVKQGGQLLLSGIPWTRRQEIIETFSDDRFSFVREEQEAEWAALLFRCG